MVLRDSLGMLGTGILIGLPLACATARLLQTWLFRLEALDPRTAMLSAGALLVIALVVIPARWAVRIDPIAALRQD